MTSRIHSWVDTAVAGIAMFIALVPNCSAQYRPRIIVHSACDTPVVQQVKPAVQVKATKQTDEDEYVDVSEEPVPLASVESLIKYPEDAKKHGLEGVVIVEALIAKDGHVEKVNVLHADHDIFKQAAIDAMLKTKFKPALQNGTPLRLWITRWVKFQLKK